MIDHSHRPEHDFGAWLSSRPRATLWVVGAALVSVLALMFVGAHHSGVTMITPGQPASLLNPR